MGNSARAVRAWVNHPSRDYWITAGAVIAGIVARLLGVHPLSGLSAGGRTTWLQTLVGVSAALLGLEIAALSIFYAVTPGPRLRSALAMVGKDLTYLFVSCLGMLAICTALLAVAMPFFDSKPVHGLGLAILGIGTMAALRTGRLFWLFWKLLLVFAQEAQDNIDDSVKTGEWTAPTIRPKDYAIPKRDPSRPRKRAGRAGSSSA